MEITITLGYTACDNEFYSFPSGFINEIVEDHFGWVFDSAAI